MRSREHLIDDFSSLNLGLYDRMALLADRHPDKAEALDAHASAVVNALTSVHERYFKLLSKLDAALGRNSLPPAHRRAPNVVSFRPPARRKR